MALPRRVMVIGAAGLLGKPTAHAFRLMPGTVVRAVDLEEMDITQPWMVRNGFDSFRPDLVINCAALTDVDACERDRDLALAVNGMGPGVVAEIAAERNVRLFYLSTDYVFDGRATSPYTEEDRPGPPEALSAYGRSKLIGEQQTLARHPAALIIRTAWMFGPARAVFPNAILRQARRGGELNVVSDQTGSPTYAPDLAAALCRIADLEVGGILHVTNEGQCTRHEFAERIISLAGLDVTVRAVKTSDFPRPARRPAYCPLSCRRYSELVGGPMRPWTESLAEFIAGEGFGV